MREGLLGQIVTPNAGNRLVPDVTWALDNGCFGDQWNEDRWFDRLIRYQHEPRCLFAAVPDVVGDAAETDERWTHYAPVVKQCGYAAAYVTQNGCERVPDDADAVFTGGDNTWKMSNQAQTLIANAKNAGMWTHMGRVNSLRRMRFAHFYGYDSVDGTYVAFGPDVNLPRLLRFLDEVHQPTLFTFAEENTRGYQ